jgi:hypothetical protein
MGTTILSSSSGSGSGTGNGYFIKEIFEVPNPIEFSYTLLEQPIAASEQIDRNGIVLSPGVDRDYVFIDDRTFQLSPTTNLHSGESIQVGYWADIFGMLFAEETYTIGVDLQRIYVLSDYALLGFLRVALNGVQIYHNADFGYTSRTKTVNIFNTQSLVPGDTLTFRYAIEDFSA